MSGMLFVIDGTDGSGKHTQAEKLYNTLCSVYNLTKDKDITMVSFPRYGSSSATMVEKYLNGEFGSDPNKIDPYTSSMFYMIDRSISFMNDKWGEIYRNGGIVIADRYYTSNIIHQGAKILKEMHYKTRYNIDACGAYDDTAEGKLKKFSEWLIATELFDIKIPKPNKIFWLMATEYANNQMLEHRVADDKSHITDIHESNSEYLEYCRQALNMHKYIYESRLNDTNRMITKSTKNLEAYSEIIRREEFLNVLDSNNQIRSIDDISSEILGYVAKYLAINGIYSFK